MTPRPPLLAPASTSRRYGVLGAIAAISVSGPFRMYLADVCIAHSASSHVGSTAELRLKLMRQLPTMGSDREATGPGANSDVHFIARRLLTVVREEGP